MWDRDERYEDILDIIDAITTLLMEARQKCTKQELEELLKSYEDEKNEIEEQYEQEAEDDRNRLEHEYWADQF